jgi:hypothetical protein
MFSKQVFIKSIPIKMECYTAVSGNTPAAGPQTGARLIVLYQEGRHLSLGSIFRPIMILAASEA